MLYPLSITNCVGCGRDAMLGALGHTMLCVHAMVCWYSFDNICSPEL